MFVHLKQAWKVSRSHLSRELSDVDCDWLQLRNAVHDLSYAVLHQLHDTLELMKGCKGARRCNPRFKSPGEFHAYLDLFEKKTLTFYYSQPSRQKGSVSKKKVNLFISV